jgi:putative hemolysin
MEKRARIALASVAAAALLAAAGAGWTGAARGFPDVLPGMDREAVLAVRNQTSKNCGRTGGQECLAFESRLAGQDMMLFCFFEDGRLAEAVWAARRPLDRMAGQKAYDSLVRELTDAYGPADQTFWTPFSPESGPDAPGKAWRQGPFSLSSEWRRDGLALRAFARGRGERVEIGVEVLPAKR